MTRSFLLALCLCLLATTVEGGTLKRILADFSICDVDNDGLVIVILDPQDGDDCTVGGGTAAPHICLCDLTVYTANVNTSAFVLSAGDTMTGELVLEDGLAIDEGASSGWDFNIVASDLQVTRPASGALVLNEVTNESFVDMGVLGPPQQGLKVALAGGATLAEWTAILINAADNTTDLNLIAFTMVSIGNDEGPAIGAIRTGSNAADLSLSATNLEVRYVGLLLDGSTSRVEIAGPGSTTGTLRIRDTDGAGWTCLTTLNGNETFAGC